MSLAYKVSKVPGLRRLLAWQVKQKIKHHVKREKKRTLSDPLDLGHFERSVFSQNGEDGMIEEIFRRIGVTDRFFVEFGMEDGQECNGRYLLEKKGWSGLWMDGGLENIESAQKNFEKFPIQTKSIFIHRDNIVSLFEDSAVPMEFDLLCIDIDGNDYWVWQALGDYRPRVVVIEYNANFVPPIQWVMPYNEKHSFNGSAHYGASLQSLDLLAEKMGYSLVGCDSMGVNAFFVRKDLLGGHFSFHQGGASHHYNCPKYRGLSFGHPHF